MRTKSSAEANFEGLYPQGTGPNLLQKDKKFTVPPIEGIVDSIDSNFAIPLGYQAPPLRHRVAFDDTILRGYESGICPISIKYGDENLESELFKDIELRSRPFFDDMAQ